ncbi:MAG: hypothetical protein LBK77_03820 [Spirochaetaceae bacterium]|jgi:hypothetical protein|nr:hypothetical protein [Spirochaetaceae bacterium]
MAKEKTGGKYPKGDSRRFFERRYKNYDWNTFYEIAASHAKEFNGRDLNDKTVHLAFTIGLGKFIRYSTDFCGELNGYMVSAAALKTYKKIKKINSHRNGPHYMEHLIPVDQFTRELLANPTVENAKRLYKAQRIVYTLREEVKEYQGRDSIYGKDFDRHRTDSQIKRFKKDYGIVKLPDMPEGGKKDG